MKGIVWGSTLERAKEQLERIKERYLENHYTIDTYRNNKNDMLIIFSNGDYWMAKGVNESCRAYRNNIGYIDALIPKAIIEEVLIPTLTLGPYNAFQYFG